MGQKQTKLTDFASKPGEKERELSREELQVALDSLAKYLHKKKLHLKLIVAGGFVSLEYFRLRDATQDVDVIFRTLSHRERSILNKGIKKVALKHDLPHDWCNNHCELFFPPGLADDPVIAESKVVVFVKPGLCLVACSMRHSLANKLKRMTGKDSSDAKALLAFIQRDLGVSLSTKQELEVYLNVEITDAAFSELMQA